MTNCVFYDCLIAYRFTKQVGCSLFLHMSFVEQVFLVVNSLICFVSFNFIQKHKDKINVFSQILILSKEKINVFSPILILSDVNVLSS